MDTLIVFFKWELWIDWILYGYCLVMLCNRNTKLTMVADMNYINRFSSHFLSPSHRAVAVLRSRHQIILKSDRVAILDMAHGRYLTSSKSQLHQHTAPYSECWPSRPPWSGLLSLGLQAVRRGCLPPASSAHVALRGSLERRIGHRSEEGTTWKGSPTTLSSSLGIIDAEGSFINIFTRIPGRVHDARLLRFSPFFRMAGEDGGVPSDGG